MAEKHKIKAVIFDMDGVLIDSEPLWQKAEFEVFSSLGVTVTKEMAEITRTMTTAEVAKFWYTKFPWTNTNLETTEQLVIEKVTELIKNEGLGISGIKTYIESLRLEGFKIGLATNSPYSIIPIVLEKLNLTPLFDSVSSSDDEENGKPDPAVYLTASRKLGVAPNDCIAIEDSYSGMRAAKSAGMRVAAFTNNTTNGVDTSLADCIIENFNLELQKKERLYCFL
ncbi:hexitol phosphatase HxpB [Flavobacterium sp. Fl-318]|uniref:Hexitol phosphatase HxpB n=1 Tax=Flavobacterium cupriresistens TaxID=2893885 RepID=A0ABU4R9Y0_9FLAO|nr:MULTISPECIES: hexitol phosphatase HxpB [unclassified Flavobacterium]MDX6189398.1 hexitol phosphatase HxpB [Flavobacterium sp. Fl-318]UFH41492.1 hexitol phosphatase HxpB [Flavobacterium sp. F-323]